MVAALAARNPLKVHLAHAISSSCIFPQVFPLFSAAEQQPHGSIASPAAQCLFSACLTVMSLSAFRLLVLSFLLRASTTLHYPRFGLVSCFELPLVSRAGRTARFLNFHSSCSRRSLYFFCAGLPICTFA
jgi:hypothetical protein